MTRFILVDDDQLPVSPREAAIRVADDGLPDAARFYGVSAATLRRFLTRNKWQIARSKGYVVSQQLEIAEGGEPDADAA